MGPFLYVCVEALFNKSLRLRLTFRRTFRGTPFPEFMTFSYQVSTGLRVSKASSPFWKELLTFSVLGSLWEKDPFLNPRLEDRAAEHEARVVFQLQAPHVIHPSVQSINKHGGQINITPDFRELQHSQGNTITKDQNWWSLVAKEGKGTSWIWESGKGSFVKARRPQSPS